MSEAYDYIIVGAGSAGCVLANRLSADPAARVLLIEAGGPDKHWLINIPKGFGQLVVDPRHSWTYKVDQHRPGGVDVNEYWVRGKVLGGSSSINGMIYMRGEPADYDLWEQAAGPEWGWAAMKQAFRSIEDHELGDNGVRGVGGAVGISTATLKYPIAERLIEAGQQMGLTRKDDLNDEDHEGIGYVSHNIRKGRRQSSATAFLKPVRNRRNLTVVTDTLVDRILFDGTRATGIACRTSGRETVYRSRGEIVVSAGALNSPKLLQLSGIGPAGLLQSLGIPVVADSRDCGSRFREHLGFMVTRRLVGDPGLNNRLYGIGLLRSIARYLAFHDGVLSTGPLEVGAFVKAHPEATRPDLQLYLGGLSLAVPEGENVSTPAQAVEKEPGLTISGQLLQLTSEGTILIASPDPDAPVDINPNWMTTDYDREAGVAMVRYIRRLLEQPAIKPFLGEETRPGPQYQTDAELLRAVETLGTCGLHGVASCRMGTDAESVVDERLRVRGVEGLRVADCSVMPSLTSGNTNGPAMALGWRASDIILADRRAALAA